MMFLPWNPSVICIHSTLSSLSYDVLFFAGVIEYYGMERAYGNWNTSILNHSYLIIGQWAPLSWLKWRLQAMEDWNKLSAGIPKWKRKNSHLLHSSLFPTTSQFYEVKELSFQLNWRLWPAMWVVAIFYIRVPIQQIQTSKHPRCLT